MNSLAAITTDRFKIQHTSKYKDNNNAYKTKMYTDR